MNGDEVQIRQTDSGYKYELSLQRSVVIDALTNLGRAQSIDHLNSAVNYAVAAIQTLENMLSPYHANDDKYNEAREGKKDETGKEVTGFFKVGVKSLDEFRGENPDMKPDKIESEYDNYKLNIRCDQLREWFVALMKLQDRKNLLLEEATEDDID